MNWISTTWKNVFLILQLLNIWTLSLVPLGRWRIRRRLTHWRWVGRWRNGALEERGPSSWHWTAGRTFPMSHGRTTFACGKSTPRKIWTPPSAVTHLCCISYCVRCVHVPVAHITGPVFVSGAACATTDAIDVLVTLRGVLCKIYASSKHATDIRMTLIKSFMDDGIYEWRAWKK